MTVLATVKQAGEPGFVAQQAGPTTPWEDLLTDQGRPPLTNVEDYEVIGLLNNRFCLCRVKRTVSDLLKWTTEARGGCAALTCRAPSVITWPQTWPRPGRFLGRRIEESGLSAPDFNLKLTRGGEDPGVRWGHD